MSQGETDTEGGIHPYTQSQLTRDHHDGSALKGDISHMRLTQVRPWIISNHSTMSDESLRSTMYYRDSDHKGDTTIPLNDSERRKCGQCFGKV